MKLNEFKKQVEELGSFLEVEEYNGEYQVTHNKLYIGYVSKLTRYQMAIAVANLDKDIASKLQKLMYKFSRTPIDERKPEKKFYVKVPKNWEHGKYFYNADDGIALIDSLSTYVEKFKFTMQEIKDYKLESFERVEVKE